MISSLQSRMHKLESAVAPNPLKPKGNIQSKRAVLKNEHQTTERSVLFANRSSVPVPAAKRGFQTLRSRSFRVMRHLINVVDTSHLDQLPKGSKISVDPVTCRKSGTPNPNASTVKPKLNQSNRSRLKKATDNQELENDSSPDEFTSRTPIPGHLQAMSIAISKMGALQPDESRVFHPKRTRKKTKTLSQPTSSASHPQLPRKEATTSNKPTSEETSMTEASQKTTHSAQQPKPGQSQNNRTAGLFEYQDLANRSNRFALLKHDPNISDLLPQSKEGYRFNASSTKVEIEDLPRASQNMIQRQKLGVWEWKEGTTQARFQEYRIPTSKETIRHRRFRFVGWAWKGELNQHPPRIKDLPSDVSQDCDTLRWYWFKDHWLLFFYHD